jgi:hypothetical protein
MAPTPPSSAQFLSGAAQSFANMLQSQNETAKTAVAQEQAETEAKAQQENQDYHQDVLKQSIVRDKAALAFQTAQHNLAAEQANLAFTKDPAVWSQGIPGGTQTGQTPTSKTFSMPNTGIGDNNQLQPTSVTMQDPQLAAQQQAKIQQTLLAPAAQNALNLQQSKSFDEYQREMAKQILANTGASDVEKLRAGNALEVENRRAASSAVDARIRAIAEQNAASIGGQARLGAASITSGQGVLGPDGTIQPVDTTSILQRAASAQFGQDDLAKLAPGIRSRVALEAPSAGIQIPTVQQKQFVGQLPGVQNTLNAMQQYNDLYAHTPAPTLLDPGSQQNQALRAAQAQVNSGLDNSLKLFTAGGRMNKQQIEDFQKAYGPSLMQKGPIDAAKMQQFQALVKNTVKGNLNGFSDENINNIMHKNMQGPQYAIDPKNGNRPVVSYDGGKTAYYRDTNEIVTDMGGQ